MSPLEEERETLLAQVEALSTRLTEIDEDRAALRGKLDKAKVDRRVYGEETDQDWARRAKGALRHLGVERNQVCQSLSYSNRRLREINNMLSRDLFRDATRDVVDDATWERIVMRCQDLQDERRRVSNLR